MKVTVRRLSGGLAVATLLCLTLTACRNAGTEPSAALTASVDAALGADVVRYQTVTAGLFHSCGVTPTGTAYCWGGNMSGQLGNNTTGDYETPTPAPVRVVGGLRFAMVSASYEQTCGATNDGVAYCWGDNEFGTLGDGTTTDSPTPVAVAGELRFATVSAGDVTTCGVTPSGALYCWGSNLLGEFGNGTTADSPTPTPAAGGLRFATVSVGVRHACGVTPSGRAYCWGWNSEGQLGNDTTNYSTPVPVAVAGGLTFATISSGWEHTCALTRDGTAYCWGRNVAGYLGDGTTTSSLTPVAVTGGLKFVTISAGWTLTCGVTPTGTAYCWGGNWYGQLGNGSTSPYYSTTPLPVVGGLKFATVSAGAAHTCGVARGGTAYCWGEGVFGDLGDGSAFVDRAAPVEVVTPSAELLAVQP